MNLPTSLLQLLGRQVARVATSFDRTRIFFDTYATDEYPRTRYAYDVDGVVVELKDLTNIVGYEVEAIQVTYPDSGGRCALVFWTTDVDRRGIVYFSKRAPEEALITEDGEIFITEEGGDDCSCLIVSGAEYMDVTLTDVDVGKKPPYLPDPDGKLYVVEEGDVRYPREELEPVDCEGACA